MKQIAFLLAMGMVAGTTAQATDPERATRIGEEALLTKETPHPVPLREGGGEVWRDVFHHKDASYIAVHFERFELARGERVVVRTPDDRYRYTFEGEGKKGSGGTFWATHVPGDTCEVIYYGNGGEPGYGYVVDKFAHGYPRRPTPDDGGGSPETICGEDDGEWARCFENTEPQVYQRGRAVARLSINGVFGCTGWLVGCEGHLMTNSHCITNPVDAMNTDFEFMAEGATCETPCNSSGACEGVIEASSSELISSGTQATLDYAMVLLPTNVSAQYGFFRLRPEGPSIGERIYIVGHPAGWGKQMYFHSDTDASGFCEIFSLDEAPAPGCSAAGPPDVGYMCDSQSGSSGSPVISYVDHRVVVLHHCGGCPNRGVPLPDIVTAIGANMPQCALGQPDGLVTLTSDSFGCSSSVGILMQDDDLAGDGTHAVSVSSSSEPGGESVVLTETPPSSGTFTGSIALTPNAASAGDGFVSVVHGDVVTVLYVDADDGAGGTNVPRTAAAGIDCALPVISDVAVEQTTGDGAIITWTTNEPAHSAVTYGSVAPPSVIRSDPDLTTSHRVVVTGLAPCSTYVFSVQSSDAGGNLASDTNGGAFYTFTTGSLHTLSLPSTDTPVAIPDNSPAGVTSSIAVTDAVTVTDVNVTVNITHPYTGDLELYLIPPSGDPILLADMRGGDGDNYTQTVFDDEAATSILVGAPPYTGSFRPERPLSDADGLGAAGTWGLKIADVGPTDFGTLESWTLHLSYTGGCGPSAAREASVVTDTCAGTGGSGGDGVLDPGEDVALPVTLRNDGTIALTGVSAALSTSTPGVTVTRSVASFPDLPLEATGSSNAPHFAFTIASAVACGTLIDFVLTGSSNEGAFFDEFQMMVGAPGIETITYPSSEVPRPLPDTITVTSTVTVADTRVVRDVDVSLRITHTYVSDLEIFLIGPTGTRVELSTGNGGTGDNYTDTIFDDEAERLIVDGTPPFTGRYRPETALSAVDGIAANGVWTLEITDAEIQDPGLLEAWSLTLTTGPDLACGTCSVVAPTAEVENVRWAEGPKNHVTWDPAAGSAFYNLYRGELSSLIELRDGDPDSCLRLSTAGEATGETLDESPADSAVYWYLVRAANSGGEGPAGSGSAGPRVHDSAGACP